MGARGFTLVEVVMTTLVLSLGVVLFGKATSNTLTASTDNAERQRVALMASDINNVMAARVASLPVTANQQAVINSLNGIMGELRTEATNAASSQGYRCEGNRPVMNGGTPNRNNSSTLFRSWTSGPPVCFEFVLLNNINTGFNGVWVETRISWLGLKNASDTPETIRVPGLISPL